MDIKRITFSIYTVGLLLLSFNAKLYAQNSGSTLEHIRVLETDDYFTPINVDGVAFPPNSNILLRLKNPGRSANVVELVSNGRVPGDSQNIKRLISEAINITYDVAASELILLDESSVDIFSIYDANGNMNPAAAGKVDPNRFGIRNPAGVASDPDSGTLYILDNGGTSGTVLVKVDPVPSGASPDGRGLERGRVSRQVLKTLDSQVIRGLALNPVDGNLYTIGPASRRLYKIKSDGFVEYVGDFPLAEWNEPEALVFAPSLDQTDDPDRWHLFIASSAGVSGQVDEWYLRQ